MQNNHFVLLEKFKNILSAQLCRHRRGCIYGMILHTHVLEMDYSDLSLSLRRDRFL